MRARVGPVSAAFSGSVRLTDIKPPESYVLMGEGKGGAAGFAKGSARVALEDPGDGTTVLRYTVEVSVGGRLAQLGSRLVGGAMNQYATSFVGTLSDLIAAEPVPVPAPAVETPAEVRPAVPRPSRVSVDRRWRLIMAGGGILAVLAVLVWLV